jgi:PIN domain nuclease of toxin-antitoxin system
LPDRIELNLDSPKVARQIGQLDILPINMNLAQTSTQLDFRSHPADELIAATSIAYGVPLVAREQRIRNSKLVPLAT